MNQIIRLISLLPLVAIAGCTSMGGQPVSAPTVTVNTATAHPALSGPSPAQTTASALANTSVSAVNFIDPAIAPRLSGNDRSQASNAQFYALQFGRPGAPRAWSGDAGTKGSVSVGPYVRVNNLDCRDFTHTVTMGGTSYARKGTACREGDGTWAVVGTTSAA